MEPDLCDIMITIIVKSVDDLNDYPFLYAQTNADQSTVTQGGDLLVDIELWHDLDRPSCPRNSPKRYLFSWDSKSQALVIRSK